MIADVPEHAPDVFAALASPVRRRLLTLLRDEGAQPVHRLAERFEMRRPSLSEHLRVLRDAGLVVEERAGRERHYGLRAEPLREIADWLTPYERFWRTRLTALREALDTLPEQPDAPPDPQPDSPPDPRPDHERSAAPALEDDALSENDEPEETPR